MKELVAFLYTDDYYQKVKKATESYTIDLTKGWKNPISELGSTAEGLKRPPKGRGCGGGGGMTTLFADVRESLNVHTTQSDPMWPTYASNAISIKSQW